MDVAVVGGGVVGLAAAQHAHDAGHDVTLVDETPYERGADRVAAWGGAVPDYDAVPRGRDAPGYVREIEEFVVERGGREATRVALDGSAFVDRPRFENAWGADLRDETAVTVRTERVDETRFWRLCEANDLVVDASGPRPVSETVFDDVGAPTRTARTFNAVVDADVSHLYPAPRVRRYRSGYAWANPLTESRASLGAGVEAPEADPGVLDEFRAFCADRGVPVARDDVRVKQIPLAGGRAPADCEHGLRGARVALAGDAACVADPNTATGLSRGARSARLAVETAAAGRSYAAALRRLLARDPLGRFVARHLTIGQKTTALALLGRGRRPRYRRLFDASGDPELLRELARLLAGRPPDGRA
jgi:flavin-dependent dehydrogenase